MRIVLFLLLAFTLSACARVQTVDYAPAITIPPGAHPAPIMYAGTRIDLPPGQDIGVMSSGGRFCGWPYSPVNRTALRGEIDPESLENAFHDILETQGYDVVNDRSILFDREEELMRGEYKIAARITAVQINACEQETGSLFWIFSSRSGTEGEFYLAIDWTVYDNLDRKSVYKTRTEGYSRRRTPNQEGMMLLITDAFEMAAHNLGTDPRFHDLIFAGIRPEAENKRQPQDDRPRLFDAREDVTITAAPLSKKPFEADAERIRRAAVMIETGLGHGSGFFITKQGHILTNDHVVGDAQRVRVNIPGRKDAIPAEVIRRSDRRDVALLRLENVPGDLNIVTLPVRHEWPAVSETIFAVGAPVDRTLANTVTRGIVSAHREKYVRSRKLNMIQADVEIHGGNSGGPLLDAFGNIVGIAVEGYGDDTYGVGLNLFIPIAEALEAVDIGQPGAAYEATDRPRMIQN